MNTVNNNFAEELAAKLGKVESSAGDSEVNTKPIKKQSASISSKYKIRNIFTAFEQTFIAIAMIAGCVTE